MTDAEMRRDLAKLKDIAAAHKSAAAALATEAAVIDGRRLQVFSKVPANLGEIYRSAAVDSPCHSDSQKRYDCFIVYEGHRYTFAEVYESARRLARLLQESYGIGKGDRVAVCGRNSPQWCISYMAATLSGAVVVPMNSWWKGPELEYGLEDSGSRVVVADPPRLKSLQPALKKLQVAAIPMDFHDLLASTPPLTDEAIAAAGVQPEDDASIMYTSGSTGRPKGVLSTHRNIISALYTWKFVKEINEILRPELMEDKDGPQSAILCTVPLFHVTGSHAQFLSCFLYRRKLVMMYKWDPQKALELIEQERVTILHGVPTMTWEVMQAPGFSRADLSSLRNVQAGGAPRPPGHVGQMVRRYPSAAQPGLGYGLTETNAIGAVISGPFYVARPASTGRPSPPVTEVKIVDPEGRAVAAGESGEVCIRGPTVMRGYWRQPQATAAALQDGWFHTGDIGMLDELGFLTLLDRAKDIVIRGGENIACAEVEYAIAEHPAVHEVSAYGVPDTRLGEALGASVMLGPGAALDGAGLRGFLASRIADFKIPRYLFFQREPLTRLASGKIARRQLRQEAITRLGRGGGEGGDEKL